MNAEGQESLRPPVIAIVGRPNVGKSTLFNRLTRSRDALVADIPGLTRDRHYGRAEIDGRRFILIDTGGFEPVANTGVEVQMAKQARQAILEADLVIFLVDVRQGLTNRDREIAGELRRTAQRLRLVVNKAEGMNGSIAESEFHALGLGEPTAISSAHGDGVVHLIDECLDELGVPLPPVKERGARSRRAQAQELQRIAAEAAGEVGEDREDREDREAGDKPRVEGDAASAGDDDAPGIGDDDEVRPVRVAVVGRPNSGKSTLINQLLGEERLIAFDAPGTTRDSIEVDFRYDGLPFVMIDTAGIRRRGKVTEVIEKFSVVKTLQSIEDCHVCILMIDANEGVSEQDAAIASYILEAGRALVVALNKWDLVSQDQRDWVKREFERKLHFLSFARMHLTTAKDGRGLKPLMRSVREAYAAATARLSTPKLTRLLQAAVEHQQPPRKGPIRPKMRYAHQGGQNPPIIVIHGTALNSVADSYRRFLEGWFRDHMGLEGTPLRIEFRTGRNPYAPSSGR